jgi:lipopolysaccharide export system protein LptA
MAVRSIKSQAARSLVSGFVLGAALLALAAGAQTIAGHDSDAPVNFAADRIEMQDKQKRVVLSGNVNITQADLQIRAARTTLAYTDQGSLKIQRIDATGGVQVTRGDQSARGDVAIYDFNRRIITLAGNVALLSGTDNLQGGRLVIDLASGVSSVDGSANSSSSALGTSTGQGGRVSGTFAVPKKSN